MDISDVNDFVAGNKVSATNNDKITNWWNNISNTRRKILKNKIVEAIIYNKLRELARWLTIKNINALRIPLLNIAKNKNFTDIANIYFSTIDEVLNNKVSKKTCGERKILCSAQ